MISIIKIVQQNIIKYSKNEKKKLKLKKLLKKLEEKKSNTKKSDEDYQILEKLIPKVNTLIDYSDKR